uniref:MATH domain-containing protein n=1 Tax=Davidia involucrata TaxID=16924 RepID=A0A5B6YTY4_DAVIN
MQDFIITLSLCVLLANHIVKFCCSDTVGGGKRFHRMKLEWGFDQFVALKTFNDASNGYLVDDTCVFGAEVFVCKERSTHKGECLSMVKDAIPYKHTWKIENFSKLDAECYDSNTFNAGDHKWKIQLYPKGKDSGTGSHLSLYLALADSTTLPPGSKIFADFTLRILDQIQAKHYYGRANYWFSASRKLRGWPRFVTHSYFNLPNVGLLVKGSCSVEAEVTIHGVANAL